MPSLLATSGTEAPAASSASAWRSLRTICSGVCLFFIESPPSTHLGRSDSHSSWISFRGAGQSPPIYYDLLFSAWADLERGDLQRTIVDTAVAAETYIRTIVYDGLPPDLEDTVRAYVERANISQVRDKFFPARLNAQQKKRYRTLKPKLEQLFTHRNDLMHKGRKQGLTADHCKTLVKSVSELISL